MCNAKAPKITTVSADARLVELLKALEEIAARGPIEGYNSAAALRLRLVAVQSIARSAIAKVALKPTRE